MYKIGVCNCCGRTKPIKQELLIVGTLCEECYGLNKKENFVSDNISKDTPTMGTFMDYVRSIGFYDVFMQVGEDLRKNTWHLYFTGVHKCVGNCGCYLTFNCIDKDNTFYICRISVLDSKGLQYIKVEQRYLYRKITILYNRKGKDINLGDFMKDNPDYSTFKDREVYKNHHPFYDVPNIQYIPKMDR